MPHFVCLGSTWLNLGNVIDVTVYESSGNSVVSVFGSDRPIAFGPRSTSILLSALEVLSIPTPVAPIRSSSLPIAAAAGQVS